MKNKNTTKQVALKEAFNVGDMVRINTNYQDGRGGYDKETRLIKLLKINKVTAFGADWVEGTEVVLNYTDLFNCDIVEVPEVLKENLLRA